MAEKRWQGFTEDDIKRLSTRTPLPEDSKAKPQSQSKIVRKEFVKDIGRKNVIRERMLQNKRNMISLTDADEIPDEARLNVVKKEVASKCNPENLPLLSEVSSDSGCGISNGTDSSLSASSDISSTDTSPSHGQVYLRIKEDKSYEVISHDQISNSTLLDEFQIKHKMMEEQNKRRKELLAKALADRKKQTHEEARRLQQIQDELQKLDILLSNDVSILRNQIEAASLEFMEAQKRYNRAEKEFLDAKLCLFAKLERKELLTEHLCTIIEQNEMRKARKLSELMDKLELSTSIEINEEEKKNVNGNMILSPLRALDEVSYATCNTLKNRQGTAIIENPAIDNEVKKIDNSTTTDISEKSCVSSGIPPALSVVSDSKPLESSNVPQEGDIPEEICLAPKE